MKKIILFLLLACSLIEVSYSAVNTINIPGNVARSTKKYFMALNVLELLEKAYNDKDISKISDVLGFSKIKKVEFYKFLEEAFEADKRLGKKTKLQLNVTDHSEFFDKVTIKTNWEKTRWELLSPESVFGQNKIYQSGSAEFIFRITESAKLVLIKGDDPFKL